MSVFNPRPCPILLTFMPRWPLLDRQWIRRLLPTCEQNVSLARRHLQWIKEKATDQATGAIAIPAVNSAIRDRVLFDKPLQYVLGTQPFGELDIVTRPPVLIPRYVYCGITKNQVLILCYLDGKLKNGYIDLLICSSLDYKIQQHLFVSWISAQAQDVLH